MHNTKFHTACENLEKAVNTLYDAVKDIVSQYGFIDTQEPRKDGTLRDRIFGYIYRGDILCEEYVYGIRVEDDVLEVLTVPISNTCRITMSPEDFTSEDAEWTPLRNSDILMTPTLQSIAESILQYTGKEEPYGFCLVPKEDIPEAEGRRFCRTGYASFFLFKTESDAKKYLHNKHIPEDLVDIVPVEDGDVEEPTFIDYEGNKIGI